MRELLSWNSEVFHADKYILGCMAACVERGGAEKKKKQKDENHCELIQRRKKNTTNTLT
jgi:hypothetical protein